LFEFALPLPWICKYECHGFNLLPSTLGTLERREMKLEVKIEKIEFLERTEIMGSPANFKPGIIL